MKAIGLVLLALVLAGCATKSKYASDPRAAVVGPDYLDYIAEYPRDRDTEFYRPHLMVKGATHWVDPFLGVPELPDALAVAPLIVTVPEPSQAVKDLSGKGYRYSLPTPP